MSVDTSNDNDSDSEIIEQNNVFEKTLDAATNFKHALLASLYAHVKFLKTELEEKKIHSFEHLSSKTARYYVTIITVGIVARLQKWQK